MTGVSEGELPMQIECEVVPYSQYSKVISVLATQWNKPMNKWELSSGSRLES